MEFKEWFWSNNRQNKILSAAKNQGAGSLPATNVNKNAAPPRNDLTDQFNLNQENSGQVKSGDGNTYSFSVQNLDFNDPHIAKMWPTVRQVWQNFMLGIKDKGFNSPVARKAYTTLRGYNWDVKRIGTQKMDQWLQDNVRDLQLMYKPYKLYGKPPPS